MSSPFPESSVRPSLALSRESLLRFCRLVTDELGIKMSEAKLPMLQSRLQRRLRALNLASLEAYREYLFHSAGGAEERTHFLDVVTTNKTDFFREPRHFDYLAREFLPALTGDRAAPRCKIWCAGCSTGEEPYTLAMVLAEFAAQRAGFDWSIFATDVSTKVLEHARLAIYAEERIGPVALPLRQKYLLRDAARSRVRLTPALRSRVTFRQLNFMAADYGVTEQFDAIFFRNVMIYFDRPTQEAVINKLCRHLAPGGHLFVGHAESLASLNVPVKPVESAVYRRSR